MLARSARGLATRATAEQLPAFADGVITREEYEQAMLATVRCMEERGIEVRNLRWQGERRYTFDYGGSPTFEGSQQQGQVYKDCYYRYGREIDSQWITQMTPSQDEINQALTWLQDCLADRGVDVSVEHLASAHPLEIRQEIPGFGQCAAATEEQFGFSPL